MKLRERLAELEHEQWVYWSHGVVGEVSPERRARWEATWKLSYEKLSEDEKEFDRVWADKVLEILWSA